MKEFCASSLFFKERECSAATRAGVDKCIFSSVVVHNVQPYVRGCLPFFAYRSMHAPSHLNLWRTHASLKSGASIRQESKVLKLYQLHQLGGLNCLLAAAATGVD